MQNIYLMISVAFAALVWQPGGKLQIHRGTIDRYFAAKVPTGKNRLC